MTARASAQDRVLADALSSAPTYVRVYAVLIEDIVQAGKAGVRLASKRDLADRFGVSMTTIRAALDLLARDGVVRDAGLYRYVRDGVGQPSTLERLRSWSSVVTRTSGQGWAAGTVET